MILRVPDYYTDFECTANKCEHTCCASWEIDVDEDSYDYYSSVEGKFGDKLRRSMKKDQHIHFQMNHGKCPFLDDNQLCEIYDHLGEEALCEVCSEYPRFEVEYMNIREKILAISCEEAARLLFLHTKPIKFFSHEMPGELDECEDLKEAEVIFLVEARDYAIEILQDRTRKLEVRIVILLQIANIIQTYIDQNEFEKIKNVIKQFRIDIAECKSIDRINELVDRKYNNHNEINLNTNSPHALFNQRLDVIMMMEVMEAEWIEEMNNVERAFSADSQEQKYEEVIKEFSDYYAGHEYEYENLMVYFVYRYLIKSVYDHRFLDRAKFCVVCYLTILDLDRMRYLINGGKYTTKDRIDTARIFCKEVEHSEKSLEYLEKNIAKKEVFNVDNLIIQVIGKLK